VIGLWWVKYAAGLILFVALSGALLWKQSQLASLKAQSANEKATLVSYINGDLSKKIEAQHTNEVTYEANQAKALADNAKLSSVADSLRKQLADRDRFIAAAPPVIGEASGALTRARQEATACWKLVYSGVPVVAGCAADVELLRNQVDGLLDDAHRVCRGEK